MYLFNEKENVTGTKVLKFELLYKQDFFKLKNDIVFYKIVFFFNKSI